MNGLRPAHNAPGLSTPWRGLAWLVLLVVAVAVYTLGLGGQYNPTNGDELVYTHIARLTAASGHWLPLVSDLDHMRNTKPPLLFWQAMVAGDWGRHWSLAALRTPALIYTLLTAAAVAWSVQLISRNLRTACLAACVYLVFFSTYRYGRTFLTSAPETFWLNVPMFALLWLRLKPAHTPPVAPTWLMHVGFGLAMGLGLAYKSFALVAPAAAALWCAQLLSAPKPNVRTVLHATIKVSLSAALALGIFGLWFVLDPDPGAVWQEFVIGENAGKMSSSEGYWQVALRGGGGSMWVQLLAYVQNAGLMAGVVLGLAWLGLSSRFKAGQKPALTPHFLILLAWLAVWLLVFTLPSQRSARYVIPAMPALAILVALYWDRVARGWFVVSLLLCGAFIGVLGRIAWAAHDIGIGSNTDHLMTQLAVLVSLGVVFAGLLRPAVTRACTVAACLGVYACFGLTTAPLNGASGQYSADTVLKTHHARIAVPSGFNAQFERFEFLLPGNQFVPYDGPQQLSALLSSYDAVVWLQSEPADLAPPCVPGCQVLGTRWEIKGRHRSGEITLANIGYPQSWLFRREWLVTNAGVPAAGATRP